ncbi:MAG: glycosyltransferase family 4 protein [Candidatus Levyibacteriota bacterium]
MKIVFISSAFYPSIGGVQTHALEVARELVKLGHTVSVITEDKQTGEESDNEAKNIKSIDKSTFFTHKKLYQIDIFYFKFGQAGFFKKFRIWFLIFLNRKLFLDAEIIHCHDVFFWYLPFRFLYPQKKVFTTFHGYETVFPPQKKAIQIRKWSEKLSYGNICVGNFISRWYGTKPDYVVYGGVKPESSMKYSVFRKKGSILNTRHRILLIGRLEKDIGILLYRDALRILKEKGVKFKLTICGDGTLRQELEPYGEVVGFQDKLQKYIDKADEVFASSYLTLFQVMQLGKPAFAVYTNPLKHDYLKDSPFGKYITISGSADELAKKIMRNTPNQRLLQQGKNWANKQTWESVAKIYLELWNKK